MSDKGRKVSFRRNMGPHKGTKSGLRMPLFLSTHVNKVDKKGRVSVPAAYRSSLAGQGWDGVVCLPSLTNPALDGCDLAFMEKLSAEQNQGIQAFSQAHDPLSSAVFAAARQLSFDSEGASSCPRPS